ncbi:hypothetical protein MPER_08481, partial [Moniliophthora perniciosa FA553]
MTRGRGGRGGRGGNRGKTTGRGGNRAAGAGPTSPKEKEATSPVETPAENGTKVAEEQVEGGEEGAKKDCTFCKEAQPIVIFTTSEDQPFASYQTEYMQYKDDRLSIVFETQEMMEETLILLRFNCPDTECDYIAKGWSDLKLHVRANHNKLMCDLCIRSKKGFRHEHAFDDELYSHMRERHEECFLCKRNGVRDQYFQDYPSLEHHFNTAHHPCTQSACLAQKFVVFNSTIDLQAHMVETHGADMSARDKRDARRVQANFEFEEVPGAGRSRGRRDREPPPQQQQQPQPPPPGGGGRRREGFGASLTVEGGTTTLDAVPVVKAAVRGYRASESSARDLISTIWNVLDCHLEHTASIINAFVDLLDEEDKKQDLLSSWRGFELEQRRQFPELTPAVHWVWLCRNNKRT